MTWGSPGIGKTEIIYQLAQEENVEVVSVILTLYDPTEIKGLMIYNPKEDKVKLVPMIDIPMKKFIFFIDENQYCTTSGKRCLPEDNS